jgi:autotransporter-associated beta strand protein
MRRNQKAIAAIFSASAAAISIFPVVTKAQSGVDTLWTGTTPTDYNTPSDWSTGALPGSGDTADVSNGGTVLIGPTDNLTMNEFWAGAGGPNQTGPGYVFQSGGTVTPSGWLAIGRNNQPGGYQISGGTLGSTNSIGGGLIIEGNTTSPAYFNISGSSTVGAAGNVELGDNPGSYGIVTMNGGTFNIPNQLFIGNNTGQGLFTLNSGTVNSNNWVGIGRFGGATGTLTINGGEFIHTGGNTGNGSNAFEVGSYLDNGGDHLGNTATLNLNTGGTLSVDFIRNESNTTGGATQTINLNGGTLLSNANDSGMIGGYGTFTVQVGNGGAVLNAGGNGGELGIAQPITHNPSANASDGGLTVIGGGNVTLSGAANGTQITNAKVTNTFTGNVTVINSELQVDDDAAFGLGNTITLNNGEIHNNGDDINISASRTIQLQGTGYLTPGWSGYTVNGPIVDYPGSKGNNLSIPFDSGTLTLSGSDSYSGTTTLGSVGVPGGAAGQYYWNDPGAKVGLQLGNDNALPAGTLFTFGVHPLGVGVVTTLNMNGHQATIGGLVGQSNAHIDNFNTGSTSTLTLGANTGYSQNVINSATVYTYSGTIQNTNGTINIVKTGPGSQVLAGSNVYTGTTTVNNGTLYFTSGLPSSAVTVNGGALSGTSTIGSTVTVNGGLVQSGYQGAGSLVVNGLTTVNSGGAVGAGFQGAGALNLSGGVTFNAGGTLAIGNVDAFPASGNTAAVMTTTATLNSTINISVDSALTGLATGNTYDLLSYSSLAGTGSFNLPSGSLPSRATGSLSMVNNTLVLTITGTDFLKWAGTGSVWNTSTSNTDWVLNSSSGTFVYYKDNPADTVVFDDSASGSNNQSVSVPNVLNPNAVTFNNSVKNYTLSGAGGINGLTGVTKTGTATTVLDISNTYTGATSVQQGTLQLGTGGALSPLTALVIGNSATNTSGTFVLGDSTGAVNTTVASLNTAGTGTSNSVQGGNASAVSTLTVATSSANSYAGSIGGTTTAAQNIALSFTGGSTGSLSLTGSSNFTGGTLLNSGTLYIGSNNALGSGPLTVTGTASTSIGGAGTAHSATPNGAVFASANVTLPNAFSLGTGSIALNNSGYTLNLAGAVTNTPTLAQVIIASGSGNTILSGPVNLSATSNANSGDNSAIEITGNNTTVTIASTGVSNISGFSLGWYQSMNNLVLSPVGTLNVTNPTDSLDVGQGGGASIGTVTQTTGTVNTGDIWLGKWDGSYGSYTMKGGTLNASQIYEAGANGGNGNSVWTQTGGTVNVTGQTILGPNNSAHANFILSNGTYSTGSLVLSNANSATDVTVSNGNLNAGNIVLAGSNSDVQAVLNINGGNVSTGSISSTNSNPLTVVNFNGGQVIASANSGNFVSGLTQANVYAGGAIFNTSSYGVIVSQNLTSAGGTTGLGSVSGAAVSGGSGYVAAPTVIISNGGTGATGYATINSAGSVTGVVITNPGIGYSSSAQPTFNFYGGGGSGAAVNTASFVNNTADGGLTKSGSGNLTLLGSNSYTGDTKITAGTLTVANNSALGSTGRAILYGGSTLAIGLAPPVTSFGNNAFVANKGTNIYNYTPAISASGTSAQLTNTNNNEATSLFSYTAYPISDATGFVANFTYSHSTLAPDPAGHGTGPADGITFTIQSVSPNAVGETASNVGYSGSGAVTQSICVGIEEFQNWLFAGVNGSFVNSTSPTGTSNSVPWISLTPSMNVNVSYSNDTLTETVTSNVNGSSATLVTPNVDLNADLQGGYGFVGFTASTGGFNDNQYVSNFSFNNNGTNLPNTISIPNTVVVLASASSTVQLAPTPGFSSGSVGPLVINANGTLNIANGGTNGASHGVLATPSVTFNGSGGTLNIGSNALDISSQASTPAAALAQVTQWVKSGSANNWTGTGITSSAAASDSSHLTGVGVIINDVSGSPLYGTNGTISSTFDGATPNDGDILVKYTYYGDTNLDGAVDGTDYSIVDNSYNMEHFVNGVPTTHISGWYNGDFNYDGVVDGSDYTLMDNAFNQQGASLGVNPLALVANPTAQIGGSAVPEPASLSVIAIGASALLGRRRRRH